VQPLLIIHVFDTDLSLAALQMAIETRKPRAGLIHHSDQGLQYAAHDYVDVLKSHEINISMSRKGNPYDNSFAESFMKTIKDEWKGNPEAEALKRLMVRCSEHKGGSTIPIIEYLCSIWNCYQYRPNVKLLCMRIDDPHFEDMLLTMRLIRRTGADTDRFFKNGDKLMNLLSDYVEPFTIIGDDF
jgi:hypothetical protein